MENCLFCILVTLRCISNTSPVDNFSAASIASLQPIERYTASSGQGYARYILSHSSRRFAGLQTRITGCDILVKWKFGINTYLSPFPVINDKVKRCHRVMEAMVLDEFYYTRNNSHGIIYFDIDFNCMAAVEPDMTTVFCDWVIYGDH